MVAIRTEDLDLISEILIIGINDDLLNEAMLFDIMKHCCKNRKIKVIDWFIKKKKLVEDEIIIINEELTLITPMTNISELERQCTLDKMRQENKTIYNILNIVLTKTLHYNTSRTKNGLIGSILYASQRNIIKGIKRRRLEKKVQEKIHHGRQLSQVCSAFNITTPVDKSLFPIIE
jgi:hypothetical protein